MIWIELTLLLACILVGARIGGIGLGVVAGLGLACFVFAFAMPPGAPPTTVLGMILAVVTALAVMEAAGGLALVVALAERVLRGNPRAITLLAPLVMYVLIFMAGTQHVAYALLPVIAEVAEKAGVRPERPLSISVIATQHGLIASPISAVTVALLAGLAGAAVPLPTIMLIIDPGDARRPARRHRERRLARPRARRRSGVSAPARRRGHAAPAKTAATAATPPPDPFTRAAIGCCLLFLAALVAVVLLGIFPDLRPEYTAGDGERRRKTGRVEMSRAIMILMLAAAGAMMLLFRPDPAKALAGSVMRGGLVAVVCILGVSWMGSSFFAANEATIVGGISATVQSASLGVRRRPLRALAPPVQPGGGDRHPRAGRHGARPAGAAPGRPLPGRQRQLLPADLRHGARRRVVRSDRHDPHRVATSSTTASCARDW